MNRLCGLVVLSGFAAVLSAQSASDWTDWRYSAPVEVDPTDTTRLVSAIIPEWVSARARPEWQDVRVVDETDREVAYILYARHERRDRQERAARLLEVTFAPGESTQGIVDLGSGAGVHNSIEVQTSERDFFAWVELAISPDGQSWRILRDRAPIYRFSRDGLPGNQLIRYGASQSRYLRLRVLEPSRRFALDGVTVRHDRTVAPERRQIEAAFVLDSGTPQRQTWWKAGLSAAQRVSEIRFVAAEPEFYRAVRVNASDDEKTWRMVGSGDIFRIPHKPSAPEDSERERLSLPLAETRARFWRVEVLDRNDPPLSGLQISLFTTPRRVAFRQEPGRRYRLLYGNPAAAAPEYSLARFVDRAELESAPPAAVGPETAGVVVTPWTERYPNTLWVAVAAAVGTLGMLAVRALRR